MNIKNPNPLPSLPLPNNNIIISNNNQDPISIVNTGN